MFITALFLLAKIWKQPISVKKWSEVTQLCPTLCDPMDCSLPGSSTHGIFQARILEWVAISFSRGTSWPRDRSQVSCIVGRHFIVWATRDSLRLASLILESDFSKLGRGEGFQLPKARQSLPWFPAVFLQYWWGFWEGKREGVLRGQSQAIPSLPWRQQRVCFSFFFPSFFSVDSFVE